MSIAQSFYDYNQSTRWPILDTCTLLDDRGNLLPSGLLADLHVWLPESLAGGVFIGAVSGTSHLLSLLLQATNADKTPIAFLSVLKSDPMSVMHSQALTPMIDGVVGWAVFGDEALQLADDYRFSSPQQSEIQPTSVVPYPDGGITGVGLAFTERSLTGLVQLSGEGDLEIVRDRIELEPGIDRDVIKFQLKQSIDGAQNVFDRYRGTCNSRPESDSCEGGVPIEFINGVGPDCCGRLTIELRGCAAVSIIDDHQCAVAIDCGISLSDACVTPKRLPDEDGKLPNEYDDLCQVEPLKVMDASVTLEATTSTEPDPNHRPSDLLDHVSGGGFDRFSTREPHQSELTYWLPYQLIFGSERPSDGLQELPGIGFDVRPFKLQSFDWTLLFKAITLEATLLDASQLALAINYKLNDPSTSLAILSIEATSDEQQEPAYSLTSRIAHTLDPGSWAQPVTRIALPDLDPTQSCQLVQKVLPTSRGFQSGWAEASVRFTTTDGQRRLVTAPPMFLPDFVNPVGSMVLITDASKTRLQRLAIDNYNPGPLQ